MRGQEKRISIEQMSYQSLLMLVKLVKA